MVKKNAEFVIEAERARRKAEGIEALAELAKRVDPKSRDADKVIELIDLFVTLYGGGVDQDLFTIEAGDALEGLLGPFGFRTVVGAGVASLQRDRLDYALINFQRLDRRARALLRQYPLEGHRYGIRTLPTEAELQKEEEVVAYRKLPSGGYYQGPLWAYRMEKEDDINRQALARLDAMRNSGPFGLLGRVYGSVTASILGRDVEAGGDIGAAFGNLFDAKGPKASVPRGNMPPPGAGRSGSKPPAAIIERHVPETRAERLANQPDKPTRSAGGTPPAPVVTAAPPGPTGGAPQQPVRQPPPVAQRLPFSAPPVEPATTTPTPAGTAMPAPKATSTTGSRPPTAVAAETVPTTPTRVTPPPTPAPRTTPEPPTTTTPPKPTEPPKPAVPTEPPKPAVARPQVKEEAPAGVGATGKVSPSTGSGQEAAKKLAWDRARSEILNEVKLTQAQRKRLDRALELAERYGAEFTEHGTNKLISRLKRKSKREIDKALAELESTLMEFAAPTALSRREGPANP